MNLSPLNLNLSMAAENKNPSNSLHVVVFPWLAFGHLIPFLELSKFIAKKGHKVTFVSTPRNIARLPKLPPNLSSSVTFLALALPETEGLPEGVEATVDLGTHDVSFLKKAFDGLQPQLARFLENSLPDWIIYDFAPFWLPPIAARLGISKSYFSIYPASTYGFFGSFEHAINGSDPRTTAEDFTVPPPWVPFETKVAFKLHEANWAFNNSRLDRSGVSDLHRVGHVIMGADSIFVRHCNEFEGQWVKLLEELQRRPVIPVGLMPPHVAIDDSDTWVQIKEWLDGQESASVLYVAFGSEVAMNEVQLSELALGLESSGVPFFWALRKSTESTELPDGFEERVKGRGIVWRSWAPQLSILSHDSVGGFLTHCGWSSVIEGLMFRHPLVMLPFVIDTGLIARVLGEKQVGIEIPRNDRDGAYARDSVADSVRLVMVENEGKIYREKSKEIGKIFGDRQLQDGYLHSLVNYLENKANKSE